MPTIYRILFIGCLAFVAGVFYYLTAIAPNHAALEAGNQPNAGIMRMQILLREILLFGGLALMVITVTLLLLYRRWKRDADAPHRDKWMVNLFGCTVFAGILYFCLHGIFGVSATVASAFAIPVWVVGYFMFARITEDLDIPPDF